jgi:hypothetical protein
MKSTKKKAKFVKQPKQPLINPFLLTEKEKQDLRENAKKALEQLLGIDS